MIVGEETKESILLEIEVLFIEWDRIKRNGSNSPIWTDGRELNFIREKIIREKEKLSEEDLRGVRETPPRMSELYMVRAQEIEKEAKAVLEELENNEDYLYLLVNRRRLPEEYREKIGVDGLLERVMILRNAIRHHKYVKMKGYIDNPSNTLSFLNCRKQMESLLKELEELGEIKPVKPKEVYEQLHLEL